jgi:hypothetical protein
MTELGNFQTQMVTGWVAASQGEFHTALLHFKWAEENNPVGGSVQPNLQWCRHNLGRAEGQVVGPDFDEDRVPSIWLSRKVPYLDGRGMDTSYVAGLFAENIKTFIEGFDPGFHAQNIIDAKPHTMVMSTGRCGTVGLFRMLELSEEVQPHHAYWFNVSTFDQWEMMCRLISGEFAGQKAEDLYHRWMATRAAEWLSDKPGVFCSHPDTIFAPIFAALHPKSKFILLWRDEDEVVKSFMTKSQYIDGQLRPMRYSFDPEFKIDLEPWNDAEKMCRWYCRFTNAFGLAMGGMVGNDRFMTVKSDGLWSGRDVEEVLNFVGSKQDLGEAKGRIRIRWNEKAHKVVQ